MIDAPVRLSLCMIVRDSAGTLRPCLEGIRPWVDELVVVDTGSKDNTREIAAEYGARLFEFPWCDDFSAARNESIRHARGDWLLWMDSDDTISAENGRKLRELALGPHKPETLGYVMQVHCPGEEAQDVTVVDHVKLFRNLPELKFEFRIHEQLLPAIRRLNGQVEWTDLFVVHSGSDHSPAGRRCKQQRDLRLLELELADRPEHPFALFNMGMTYSDMERPDEAVAYLKRCLAVSGPSESHLRKAYAILVGCLVQLGCNQEADEVCRQALAAFSDDVELLFRQGIVAHKLGRLKEAETSYRAVFTTNGERHFSSRDRGISGFKARHNLALVYADMRRYDLAEIQWRECLAEMPGYRQGWQALGESLIGQGKKITAQVEAERLSDDLRPVGRILEAEVAKSQGRIDDAREILKEAAAEFEDADVLTALCRLLFEQGPLESALPYQQKLAQLRPDDPAVLHNLGTVLLHVRQADEAAVSLQRSLEFRPESLETKRHLAIALAAQNLSA